MKMMFGLLVLGAVLLAAGFIQGEGKSCCSTTPGPAVAMDHESDSNFANYALKQADGGAEVRLADYKGKHKAILLDVYASWCGACKAAIPQIQGMHDDYKKKGLLVVGLNVSDDWKSMQQHIELQKITYPVLHDANRDGIERPLKVEALPTVIILDGQTLQEKGRWVGMSPKHTDEQLKLIQRLGVK